jgi:phenylacetate-CoA ligase
MTTFRVRDYFLPLKILGYRRLMGQAPLWPADRLEAWGLERRRRIVEHVFGTVPHYRDSFSRLGIDPTTVDRPEVWQRIPRISKEDIRDHSERFVSSRAERYGGFWATTSGSTGMPMKILLDRNVSAAAFALFWRAWGSGGYWRLGQRQAAMKGSTHERGWRYNRKIQTLELSSSHLSEETAKSFRDLIDRYRPRFMRGYPSALYLFCRLLREQDLELHVPMIISGSETLHDFQREEIERTLGARLYNHYTHWERAASVLECDQGRLHAQEDFAYHEILDAEGSPVPEGVPGEITVTAYHNFAMPLIRYRTGDVASWSEKRCGCGQVFPVVEKILGREADYVVKPDGSAVAGTYASSSFKHFPNVLYAQIAQSEPGAIELRLVPTAEYRDPEDGHEIVSHLREPLGNDIKIEVRLCGMEDLERNPVGKIRACFNRIPRGRLAGIQGEVVSGEGVTGS